MKKVRATKRQKIKQRGGAPKAWPRHLDEKFQVGNQSSLVCQSFDCRVCFCHWPKPLRRRDSEDAPSACSCGRLRTEEVRIVPGFASAFGSTFPKSSARRPAHEHSVRQDSSCDSRDCLSDVLRPGLSPAGRTLRICS